MSRRKRIPAAKRGAESLRRFLRSAVAELRSAGGHKPDKARHGRGNPWPRCRECQHRTATLCPDCLQCPECCPGHSGAVEGWRQGAGGDE